MSGMSGGIEGNYFGFFMWLGWCIYYFQNPLVNNQNQLPSMSTQKKSDNEDTTQKHGQAQQLAQRKGKQKKGPKKEPPSQPRQYKLTSYFQSNTGCSTNDIPSTPDPDITQLQQMREQLQAKDKALDKMREQKQFFQNKYSCLCMETRAYRTKARLVLIKILAEAAEIRRAQRRRVDVKMGMFIEDGKFLEGEDLVKIRELILRKNQEIGELQGELAKARSDDQKDRLKFAISFLKKQLSQKQVDLKQKQKDSRIYRQRLKLSHKQLQCIYSKQKWQIIKDTHNNDRYLPLQLIGKGGFGEVYKCFDLEEQSYVAIKINFINTKQCKNDQAADIMKHVKRQVNTHKELMHGNIVRIREILEIGHDRIVFVMDFCTGPELSLYLKDRRSIQEQDAKKIIHQIFSALNYLNQLDVKVIHYDLKPSNIIFDSGIVKILDFGLCKLMDSEKSMIELTSQGVGTYWYLPPETFDYNSQDRTVNITDKVDVWSVGVIFFQLLYGVRPFGNGKSQQRILQQNIIFNQGHKLIFPDSNPNKYRISKQAKQFISECLSYDPATRIQIREAYNHKYFKL